MSFHRRFRGDGLSCTGAMGHLVMGFKTQPVRPCVVVFFLLVNSCKLMIRYIYRVNQMV